MSSNQPKAFSKELLDDELFSLMNDFNKSYRSGEPEITDYEYDFVWMKEALDRFPKRDHSFFSLVESEDGSDFGNEEIIHPIPMLSTLKCYTDKDIMSFINRVEIAANDMNLDIDDVEVSINAKIDGMSSIYFDGKLVTRGDSGTNKGYDISKLFNIGLDKPDGEGNIIGELACNYKYFQDFLSEEFDHPRGVVVGLASSVSQGGSPNNKALQAVKDKAIQVVVYRDLPEVVIKIKDLAENINYIYSDVVSECEFPVDGVVISVINKNIKKFMGHNKNHHKWQVAKKVKGEQKEVKVLGVNWQTSRTGNVNPVVQVEPTKLSGCTIKSPTGHHAGRILSWGIGRGAVVLISRSGEVIPNIDRVVKPVCASIPSVCGSCGCHLEWRASTKKGKDPIFLYCPNIGGCSAQVENSIIHFFDILGNADSFGPATVKRIVESGVKSLDDIFFMTRLDFINIGFGDRQSTVLIEQLDRCKTTPVEDWRFLGSFGIHMLGRGSSERLLKVHKIDSISSLTVDDLIKIDSFAHKKSKAVVDGIEKAWPLISKMLYSVGFNLTSHEAVESKLTGLNIVFTGTMVTGKRSDMQKAAKHLGGQVRSSVTKNTDLLVCGNNVGDNKIMGAKKNGTKVISEQDYLYEYID